MVPNILPARVYSISSLPLYRFGVEAINKQGSHGKGNSYPYHARPSIMLNRPETNVPAEPPKK